MAKLISLEGATVTVPIGWIVFSDFRVNLSGEINDIPIGESEDVNVVFRFSTNTFVTFLNDAYVPYYIYNNAPLIFEITDGTDATNQTLIQWFIDNNATIENGVWEEEAPEYTLRINGVEVTDYENVIVNGVSYKCKGKTLISFTIDGTSYLAEEGMNWYEWCNSSYNTYGYVCSSLNSQVTTSSYMRYIENVRGSDVIVNGQGYIGKYPESND